MARRNADEQRADPFGLQDLFAGAAPDGWLAPGGGAFKDAFGGGNALALAFGAAPAGAAAAGAADFDLDACACGGELRAAIGGVLRTCGACGAVVAGDAPDAPDDDGGARPAPGAARLKLVGVGSGCLQPDLYRSGSGDGAAAQKRQVLEEYRAYRQQYIEDGGIPLPLDACELATQYYNDVQRQCVKRSQNKRRIMAACYWRACLELGLVVPNADIARCMKLPNSGIAAGKNVLRALEADGLLAADADADPWKYPRAEISTLMLHIGLGAPEFAPVHAAVFDVVRTAAEKHIGTMSIPRSKVAGAAYAVLRRAALSEQTQLAPETHRAAVATVAGGLQAFCGARIRKNTVERFLAELADFHSHFEPVYASHGLDTRAGVELRADPKPRAPKPKAAAKAAKEPKTPKTPKDAAPKEALAPKAAGDA